MTEYIMFGFNNIRNRIKHELVIEKSDIVVQLKDSDILQIK